MNIYDGCPLVSVIIPVYNSSKYILASLQSVTDQSYPNIEVIVIDDCSTDNSWNLVNEYAIKHKELKCIKLKSNLGAAVARNVGINKANGKYLAFLDSDDLWEKDKLSRQVTLLEEKKCAFCYCSYRIVNQDNKILVDSTEILFEVFYKDLLKKTVVSTPTVLINLEITGKILMPLRRTGQDYAYWLILLKKFGPGIGISEQLVTVRKRSNSLSKNKFQNIIDVYQIQKNQEKLSPMLIYFNIISYVFFTIKKRFFQ